MMITDARQASYTTIRSDVAGMVPMEAKRILDVGCSNGALGRDLKAADPQRNVCGIEFDPGFAQAATKVLDSVIDADVNLLDWKAFVPGQSFDCIIFADVLEHLVQPQHVLTHALSRLAPGGSVVVSLPNVRHVSALWSIFVNGRFPRHSRGIFDSTHLRWFTYLDAQQMLEDAGLQISAEAFALRWRDQGGGLFNRALNKLPASLHSLRPIREFLAYQMSFRGETGAAADSTPQVA